MTSQEDITTLREEIKNKERQLYRAEKEMSSWNRGRHKPHSNTQMSKLFVKNLRQKITEKQTQLRKMEKE